MRKGYVYSVVVILLIASPTLAKSRNASIENMLEDVRVSPAGFANTPNQGISIETTAKALTISRIIGYEVNSTLDILLYFQRSQNEDGGFGSNPEEISTWDATIKAIQGLIELKVNSTQLSSWEIDNYLNSSASEVIYTTVIENNQTIFKNKNLTESLIQQWYEYIIASISIKVIPPIPNVFLGAELKSFQLSNGTYNSFGLALKSNRLLNLLAQEPDDAELASKFIRAYATTYGMFSSTLDGVPTLKDTYEAIEVLNGLGRLGELENQNKIILKILELQEADNGFKEIGASEPTIDATWYAVNILSLLDSLPQLLSPDVLQTQGFVNYNSILVLFSVIAITIVRRKQR